VVFLTSPLSYDLVRSLATAGGADVIPNPVQADEFAARVRNVLRGARREAMAGLGDAWEAPVLAAGEGPLEGENLAVLDAAPAWMLIVDSDLRLVFANQSYLAFRGRGSSDLVGRPLEEVLLPGMVEGRRTHDVVREAVGSGRPGSLATVRFRSGAGEERVADLKVSPFERSGERHGLVVMHDVSDHWWAREAIHQEKRKLEEIVNGMGASLAVLDKDLRVQWANRTFKKWFGEMWGERFELALRGLMLVGDTDPERIFTGHEHTSKEWAHYTERGDKRYFRNIVLPSHDTAGGLRELVLVTQDLTEVTLRAEQHQLLRDLANLLQTTLELDRLLYIILTCATAGHALGFNRAFVFLVDEERGLLRGRMGVGPASPKEAFALWAEMAGTKRSLADLTSDFEQFRSDEGKQTLTRLVEEVEYPLRDSAEILARTVVENEPQLVRDAANDPRVTEAFRELFGAREFVSVPLASKARVVGVLLGDNVFSGRPISSDQVAVLDLFAAAAGLAVDNARTYAELKRSMERLEDAQEALIHSERLATVGRLAAHVAHEIRNPLVTIGGFARSILKWTEDTERVRSSAGIIYEEVLRLEQILSGVMDFTRPARLFRRTQPVNELVERLATKMGDEVKGHEVTLELDLAEDLPPCPVDAAQFTQVLVNLLRNAMESLATAGAMEAERTITFRTRRDEDAVLVHVEDSGPGIPPDLRSVLFEPFISRKAGGTGLGLAVVKKIMLDHGGDASAENLPDGGARIILTLPLTEVSPPHLEMKAREVGMDHETLSR
jgi:PAS domain S-box-containing protein